MSTRTRRRSGKSHRWLIALSVLLGAGLVLILLMPTLVMGWVRSYLQAETFRDKMEEFFGTEMRGEVALAPLKWSGDEVSSAEAVVTTADGWRAQMDGLHLTLDWNAFRQGKWRMVGTGVDSILVERQLGDPNLLPPAAAAAEPSVSPVRDEADNSLPSWLRRYLPDEAEVDGLRVNRFSLMHPGPWNLRDAQMVISPWRQGETSIQAVVEGGIVETPLMLPAQTLPVKLNLNRASLRLSREDFHLKEATLKWLKEGEITARGHVRPQDGTWEMSAHVVGVPLQECLTDVWRLRLSGVLEGDLAAQGSMTAAPVASGSLNLRNGVLTALPVLDWLATYTGVERFKRLVLDVAKSEVRAAGNTRHFDKVILQSNGLLYLDGNLVMNGEEIDGRFMLGVTPETLKWIPGAQQHVFTSTHPSGPAGMLWTTLHITGTTAAPKEDLSARLAAAAGKSMLDLPAGVATRGSEMLLTPLLGEDAAKLPTEVIKNATDTTGKAVETGVKLLEGISGGLLGP